MIQLHKGSLRGNFDFGWLNTFHTFSFGEFYDPERMGFRGLRVINEDFVAPQKGFPTHRHRDMEIITYILEGALEHKDSLGNGSVIRPGEIQRMSAGTGVQHSEFNASADKPVHLLQIWIEPRAKGLPAGYEQKAFDFKSGQLNLVVSPDGRNGSLSMQADASLYVLPLSGSEEVRHSIPNGRSGWIQVSKGKVAIQSLKLTAGDGVALEEEREFSIKSDGGLAEVLYFDLP